MMDIDFAFTPKKVRWWQEWDIALKVAVCTLLVLCCLWYGEPYAMFMALLGMSPMFFIEWTGARERLKALQVSANNEARAQTTQARLWAMHG